VLTRETLNDPFIEIHGWQYALSLLVEADWRRMLGFGYFDKGEALTPDAAYDYRITGRFRRRELHEKLLGFHTIPLGTSLPTWFQFDSVLVATPQPGVVDMFPAPPANSLRAVGTKGIALAPQGAAGRCLSRRSQRSRCRRAKRLPVRSRIATSSTSRSSTGPAITARGRRAKSK
jgi:hypothetical protein